MDWLNQLLELSDTIEMFEVKKSYGIKLVDLDLA